MGSEVEIKMLTRYLSVDASPEDLLHTLPEN
jgi:hypothetical protein